MEIIPLPPNAPVLMEATRAIGYSLETAVADIIDNSITANADQIDIYFFPVDNPYIAIVDNGIGMDRNGLINAMRYGSQNPLVDRITSDLGRFGLGLKTASMSQCRKLTVISRKYGKINGAQWDLNFVAQSNDWSLKLLDDCEIGNLPHVEDLIANGTGTLVLWQDFDRLSAGEINFDDNISKKMDRVRSHLSLVFHRYLSGEVGLKKVRISINRLPLEPIDPFLAGKSTQVMDEEPIIVEGHRVIVRPYILPHVSSLSQTELNMLGGEEGLRKQQGFYVYRNKRLIVWGTWFRMMRKGELSKLARVRVDIPNSLDYLWTLDIKKSVATPPEIVRRNLAPIIAKLAESSKRTWTYRGKKETDDSKIHIWNRLRTREGGVVYEINRDHPLVEAVRDTGETVLVEQLLLQIERNLPINQLYIDLTNDQQVLNETEVSKMEMQNMITQLLAKCSNEQERKAMARRLTVTEPFDQCAEWISDLIKE
jgi:DNA mismatch repair enzyme (predicted ATPase)